MPITTLLSITDASADPKPIQSPLPILVGTGGRRMQRITARFADEWNTWGSVALAAERRAGFVAACEAVDVDPATKWTSVQALMFLTDSEDRADEIRAGQWGERSIVGSAAQLVEELGAYAAQGFDEFIVPDWNLGRTEPERRDALARIHAEVLTQL